MITGATILRILFGILSGLKAFLFGRFLISLLIFSIKTIGLILSIFYSVIASILILLRSAAPVLGKKLAARISAFAELLPIRGSLIDLLRSSR